MSTPLRVIKPEPAITLDRALPSSLEAERFILGCVLLDNQTLNQAAEKLTADDFFLISHKKIYTQMLGLYEAGNRIDPVALGEELRRVGELEMVGGPAYIASLFADVPRFSNIENYVRIVKDKSTLRRIILTSNLAMSLAYDDEQSPADVLAQIEKEIMEISESTIKKDFVRIGDHADATLTQIENCAARQSAVTGLAAGFSDLDYITSGFQRGDLLILAARPSIGKTALALNIARNAARDLDAEGNRNVIGVFSLEMSTEQLISRVLCCDARIDAHRMRSGYIGRDEWRRLALAVGNLKETELYIDDSAGITLTEMRAKARKLKSKMGRLDLLIVDYIGLVNPIGRPRSEQEAVAQISRGLKVLAKELNVPVLALSQLSRAPENRTGNHRPQLSDLRSSGSIEQDADVVMFIYREEVYKPETDKQNIAEIIVAKQRNGPTGSVELVFLKQLTRFEDKFREPQYDRNDAGERED